MCDIVNTLTLAYYGAMKERSQAGRALAALRQKVELTCPECGKTFTAFRNRRFCSNACKLRWHYRENKQKRAAS